MKRQIEIEIDPTPEEMAERFAEMSDEEQAAFFNRVAELVAEWKNPACVQ